MTVTMFICLSNYMLLQKIPILLIKYGHFIKFLIQQLKRIFKIINLTSIICILNNNIN